MENLLFDNTPTAHYGGYRQTVYFGLFEDTKTFPQVAALTATTTNADAVTAVGTLTPVTGKKFGSIQAKVHRVGQEGDYAAEDNSAAKYLLKIFLQEGAEAEGFLYKFKGAYMWFAPQQSDGTFRLYGRDTGYPARIIGSKLVHPESPDDAKGPEIEVTIEFMPFAPAYWTGTISTAAGV
ncbi:hypothetical protein [Siphonobacter sp.]|uniref:hypothetical protein n=1 Tax=Siphonobacter sp. TaxID=1869184 RepID=UPI003B3A4E2D